MGWLTFSGICDRLQEDSIGEAFLSLFPKVFQYDGSLFWALVTYYRINRKVGLGGFKDARKLIFTIERAVFTIW